MVKSSLSEKPNSGLRSTVANARSSFGERHQIHHRDMLGENEAIGAGHRHTLVLERADDGLEQRPALAHQDQKIAALRGAALDLAAHMARDAARQFHPRAGLVDQVERRVPAFDLAPLIGFLRLPDLDHAGQRIRQRQMRREAAGIGADARRHLGAFEHQVDRGQNAFAGAERVLELAEDEGEADAGMPALEIAPHLGEFLGRGILERIDRLFLVADRKDGARVGPRAGAGGEFVGEVAHDLPLLLAGVLRLVDQHMVDAEIELVVHPGGIDVAQERKRLVDEIVVVEQPAALLFLQVALQHLIGDGEER
jgi:hypothetical protein